MSLQELKEEFKQTEGDPKIRGKIKQVRQGRMRKRMIAAVPKAAVIITNPTHYSVALQYERGMEAPVCVAKGVDALALKISEVAGEHAHPARRERAARPRSSRDRRGRPGDPARALQGGRRGHRLCHEAAPARAPLIIQKASAFPAFNLSRPLAFMGRLKALKRGQTIDLPLAASKQGPNRYGSPKSGSPRCRRCGVTKRPRAGRRQAFDRSQSAPRGGSVGLVLLVALLLIAAAAGTIYVGRGHAEPTSWRCWPCSAPSACSRCSRLPPASCALPAATAATPCSRRSLDNAFDGIVVTDQAGRVFYANATYLDLIGAVDEQRRAPDRAGVHRRPRRVRSDLPPAQSGARGPPGCRKKCGIAGSGTVWRRWLRMRVRPLGAAKRDAHMTVWSIADVTRERERAENVFQELQHAIDYLDHAPAGFFSVDATGTFVYLNATLAAWLDHDLAEVAVGSLKLTDIVAGEGAALLTTFDAAPGEVKTEVLDLDLKTRAGKPLPVRLFHKVAFGADGKAGASRTLVLNRARDDGTDSAARGGSALHALLPEHADGDCHRRQARRYRAQQCAFRLHLRRSAQGRRPLDPDAASPSATAPALKAAIAKAAAGQGDIAPVEAALAGSGERWATFFVSAVEEEDRDGEAAIVYALETTAQRTLENRVYQQQKMELVGQLAGGIAHDFNNVLSAIMMATDFLLNAHKPTDPSFQDIIQIKQNANRAAALVRQLLAFSRKQTLRPQVLDLGETLSDLGMLLKRLIGEKVTFTGVVVTAATCGR